MASNESVVARPHRATDAGAAENYLLLSDVHLGSDIVPHLRPWAKSSWLLEAPEIDAQLCSMLAHYRRERDADRPWRLVIAGDFLDLVGVSIAPEVSQVRTKPTREEEQHGLGSAADHVVHKVHAIALRHVQVFRALMEFVADGHSIVIVRGNHDVELHWRAAQRALVDAIVDHAPKAQRADLAARIQICPWFYAVEGVLYVEHGHEFDAMCSYGDPLLPTCTRDPRRILMTPFSVLLRQVARPTRGLRAAGYQYAGMSAYLRLLANLGVRGSVGIALRFGGAALNLLRACSTQASGAKQRHVRRARAKFARFASCMGVSEDHLKALRANYVEPAVRSRGFVVRSLYLDRMLSVVIAFAASALAAVFAQREGPVGLGLCLAAALMAGAYACIGRGSNLPPTERMRRGAGQIANLFRARWIVMGHTHEPAFESVAPEVSYVNLGSWGEDDPPDERGSQSHSLCSFLVIRHVHGDYQAELLCWDAVRGPRPLAVGAAVRPSNPPVGSLIDVGTAA